MQELVIQSSKGDEVTTSLIVAEVFGKEHRKVLRDIESLSCSENFNTANFGRIDYTDSRGRTQKAYEMTKDGFSFLVMGYTGKAAAKFKEDFINAMEKQLRQSPDSRIMDTMSYDKLVALRDILNDAANEYVDNIIAAEKEGGKK